MELTLVFIVISAVRKSEEDEVLFLPLRGRLGGGRDKNKVNGSVLNCKSEFVGTKLYQKTPDNELDCKFGPSIIQNPFRKEELLPNSVNELQPDFFSTSFQPNASPQNYTGTLQKHLCNPDPGLKKRLCIRSL